MYTIKPLNRIAQVGLNRLPDGFAVDSEAANPDGILVRSAAMHDMVFGDRLLAIARAGAGTNNIPIDRCAEEGIVVFNTPGANANAVKELAVAALLMASRDLTGGNAWVRAVAAEGKDDVAKAVEKGKSAFAGPEIRNKTLGVIGLGAIGGMVANAGYALHMDVVGYDPYLSVSSALRLSRAVKVVKSIEALCAECDYISIHVPYTPETKHTINAKLIDGMKDGVRIINLARGELVDDEAMIAALECGKVARYVTDFPNNRITLAKNVVALPHLGASTPESEDNCAVMAANELADYLLNGNIANSVNMPACEMARSGVVRLCVLHRNVPNMLASFLALLSAEGANVENMDSKSRGDWAYTMIDFAAEIPAGATDQIHAMDGVVRLRTLR